MNDALSRYDAQLAEIHAKIKTERHKLKTEAVVTVRKLIRENELTLADCFGKQAATPKGTKLPAKYKHGADSWAGRGLLPNWLKRQISQGRSRESFRILDN